MALQCRPGCVLLLLVCSAQVSVWHCTDTSCSPGHSIYPDTAPNAGMLGPRNDSLPPSIPPSAVRRRSPLPSTEPLELPSSRPALAGAVSLPSGYEQPPAVTGEGTAVARAGRGCGK